MNKYEQLKIIIQVANSDRDFGYGDSTVRLADVLLAIGDINVNVRVIPPTYKAELLFYKGWEEPKFGAYWDLTNDNLDNQSEETKQSLINLLVSQNEEKQEAVL